MAHPCLKHMLYKVNHFIYNKAFVRLYHYSKAHSNTVWALNKVTIAGTILK